jgi:KUP system potassium uptake protein
MAATDIQLDPGVDDQAAGHHRSHQPIPVLALGALGIVFGDIGTSPLYALQSALLATGEASPAPGAVLGVVSLIFWALAIVVSLKYVAIVLRADNEGEGGILALSSLVIGDHAAKHRFSWIILLGVCGAALLYGDGAITPAISVLSAMEGLKVEAPSLAPYVIPATIAILVGLFLVQHRGTGALGVLFGPVMLSWFLVIAALGVNGIVHAPGILAAFDPSWAIGYMLRQPGTAFAVFGAIFLALTGAEALYADIGHFGAPPIRLAWFAVACPALLLNYFGQGALLLNHPDALDNPFYKLCPPMLLLPLVGLAAVATVIASQALISGVFSLTRQSISLRLMPRMSILPTSSKAYGQIYVPVVNWLLMAATVLLVLGFRSSEALASAYGIAVSGTMLFTTILLHRVMSNRWLWPAPVAFGVTSVFALVDAGFLAANSMKFMEGGWLPLALGGTVAFAMLAWRAGSNAVRDELAANSMALSDFLAHVDELVVSRVPGTAVFVTRLSESASPMLLNYIRHARVLHEHVILLTVEPTKRPRVPAGERLSIAEIGHGFYRVVVTIGFMQRPDVPTALRACAKLGLNFCREDVHYFIAHESLIRRSSGSRLGRPVWFAFNLMHKLGLRAADYFQLPAKRVMEVGFRLEV